MSYLIVAVADFGWGAERTQKDDTDGWGIVEPEKTGSWRRVDRVARVEHAQTESWDDFRGRSAKSTSATHGMDMNTHICMPTKAHTTVINHSQKCSIPVDMQSVIILQRYCLPETIRPNIGSATTDIPASTTLLFQIIQTVRSKATPAIYPHHQHICQIRRPWTCYQICAPLSI